MSDITENDVRLIRRYLIAVRSRDEHSAEILADYLRKVRRLNMVFPDEQTEEERETYLNRLLDNERWLARKFGCVLLPDYQDVIFLNSKWPNPFTMYVHLKEPITSLGELGEIYWLPENQRDKWKSLSDANHEAYLRYTETIMPLSDSGIAGFFKRLLGG